MAPSQYLEPGPTMAASSGRTRAWSSTPSARPIAAASPSWSDQKTRESCWKPSSLARVASPSANLPGSAGGSSGGSVTPPLQLDMAKVHRLSREGSLAGSSAMSTPQGGAGGGGTDAYAIGDDDLHIDNALSPRATALRPTCVRSRNAAGGPSPRWRCARPLPRAAVTQCSWAWSAPATPANWRSVTPC